MTVLLTLLTFFLDGQPTLVNLPPEPSLTAGAQTVEYEAEVEATTSEKEPRGLPRITPPSWHTSPSFMVALPPIPSPTSFDVFSSAVRPPHEFPTLFPCAPVALIACPPPMPLPEPPAVRHVSFAGDASEYRLAAHETDCETAWLPPGHPVRAFAPPAFAKGFPGKALWEHIHARPQTPPHPYPTSSPYDCEEGPFCHPAVSGPYCPVGFGGPMVSHGTPFPGAKSIQHVVRATYDVPHETAKALEQVLKGRTGVMGCTVQGNELTVNATGPAQMAIATFLATVVSKPRMVSRPEKTISVKHTKTQSCTTDCFEAKCCNNKCDCDKCDCCGTKSKLSDVSVSKTSKSGTFSFHVGFGQPRESCEGNQTSKTSQSRDFSFYVGTQDCKPCSHTQPVAIQGKASQSKPIQVQIRATANGVELRTSDGTVVRATEIRLETNSIGKLQIHQADAVHSTPKYALPASTPLKTLP